MLSYCLKCKKKKKKKNTESKNPIVVKAKSGIIMLSLNLIRFLLCFKDITI